MTFSKKDFRRLAIGPSKPPRCPLCHDQMERDYDEKRGIFIFACDRDQIAIAATDPFVGKWEGAAERLGDEMLECPACRARMRFFCTQTGFMKAKCPARTCGLTMKLAEPDRGKDPTQGKGTQDLLPS